MSYDQYKKMLAEVMTICNNKKILLLIKKHPADNIFDYSKYNILEFDGIVEELVLTQENISGTISSCSTSSLLIPALIDKESYIVSFDSLDRMDHNLRKLFEKYCEPIENINYLN